MAWLGYSSCCNTILEYCQNEDKMHTISIGLSSQWNLGRKIQRCPLDVIFYSKSDICRWKSFCLLRRWAMQQSLFLNRQTGEHFMHIPWTLKPCSSNICWIPFASLVSVIIFWGFPQNSGYGLFMGIMVSFCFHCLPLLPLFISNVQSASGPSDMCADDWSKTKRPTQSGYASLKFDIVSLTCARSCVWSHYASPLAPGYVIHQASLIMILSWLWMISHLFSSSTKSKMCMIWPCPFFISFCCSSPLLSTIMKIIFQDH